MSAVVEDSGHSNVQRWQERHFVVTEEWRAIKGDEESLDEDIRHLVEIQDKADIV